MNIFPSNISSAPSYVDYVNNKIRVSTPLYFVLPRHERDLHLFIFL